MLKDINYYLTHPGYYTLKETLSEVTDIERIKKYIGYTCENCVECQREKGNYFKLYKVSFIEKMPNIYEEISIDIKGPIKSCHFKSNGKYTPFYILAICETISRYLK
ncbi:hypothetical protein DMUE_2256 [Dictyocoela muelleri]|nr:hypothetical protein DMUE_2256 [Dictyocoela muelleri]